MSSAVSKRSDDPRLGDIIITINDVSEITAEESITLLGFPSDEGTVRNNGRYGGKDGPNIARQFIKKMGTVINPEYNVSLKNLNIYDIGNVTIGDTLEQTHKNLEEMVYQILKKNSFPFIIGGSNDQSYSNASAYLRFLGTDSHNRLGVINIDAHLDVRPLIGEKRLLHSGSPFRLLLEDKRFISDAFPAPFVEFAAQGSQCSQEHVNYIKNKKGHIYYLSTLLSSPIKPEECFKRVLDSLISTHISHETRDIFVSFDIDSIQGSDCPGVSCPATIGLSAQHALNMCLYAGIHNHVKLFDISEFNPRIEDYRTGRLVANMFYYFLLGYAIRKRNKPLIKPTFPLL